MLDWREKFMIASNLDVYAQFMTGELYSFGPEFTNEMFVNKLLRLEPTTPRMFAGTAYHKYIEEHEKYGDATKMVVNNWLIDNSNANFEIEIPTIREYTVSRNFGDIPFRGRIDMASATRIHDLKLTSKVDYERYDNSWQWRVYLEMCGYDEFKYDVILATIIINDLEETKYQGEVIDKNIIGVIATKSYHPFTFKRYLYMEEEVREFIHEYWELLGRMKELFVETAIKNKITLKGI